MSEKEEEEEKVKTKLVACLWREASRSYEARLEEVMATKTDKKQGETGSPPVKVEYEAEGKRSVRGLRTWSPTVLLAALASF